MIYRKKHTFKYVSLSLKFKMKERLPPSFPGNIHHALFIHDCFVIDSASFVLGGSRNLHSARVKSDNEKCPFRGRASVVVSVAAIIHSCAGFVCFLCHGYIHAGDGLGGVIPASGINSGAAILHSRAGFIGALSRLYSRR